MAFAIPKIEYGSLTPTVINFTYPPAMMGQKRESFNIVKKENESLSGRRQVQLNYIEDIRKLKFEFLTEAQVTQLETFIKTWAALGKSFKYFEDKTLAAYKAYELDMTKFEPKPITSVGVDIYIYEVELIFRRTDDASVAGGYVELEIVNNQVAAADVTGLLLDSDSYKSVKVFYEVFRKTGSSERICNGFFTCLYKSGTNAWELEAGSFEGSPAHGVTFSITTAGQVQYTSDNMAGTNYESRLLLRNFTIIEG
jgi:hypothetical protein